MPTRPTTARPTASRPADEILAEWRALERVVELTSDRDDEEIIRERIEELRVDYRSAADAPVTGPAARPPQQLTLPLSFAPRVVSSAPRRDAPEAG